LAVDDVPQFPAGNVALEVVAEKVGGAGDVLFHAPGDVGTQDNVVEVPERALGGEGFPGGNVQSGSGNLLLLEGSNQRLFIDNVAPGDIGSASSP